MTSRRRKHKPKPTDITSGRATLVELRIKQEDVQRRCLTERDGIGISASGDPGAVQTASIVSNMRR